MEKKKVVTNLENIMKELSNINDYYLDEISKHIGNALDSLEEARLRIKEDEF